MTKLDIELNCELLKSISNSNSITAEERTALRNAALALLFAGTYYYKEFTDYRAMVDSDLTDQQRRHLGQLGFSLDGLHGSDGEVNEETDR